MHNENIEFDERLSILINKIIKAITNKNKKIW